MEKALRIIVKTVSVIVALLVLVKFMSLLDFIGFDFGLIGEIGWYIPGWILGFVGCVLNFSICKKICAAKLEFIVFRISAVFCLLVALFDLFVLYVMSQI